MNLSLVFIPIISAFIGWVTNWLAIKLLFHPREQKRFLRVSIQGILPKRQRQFAMKLGKLASAEFFSFNDLEGKIANPENVSKILPLLEVHIDTFLREKLTAQIPMLGMLIGDKTIAQVKAVFMKELEELFPVLMRQYLTVLQADLNIEKIVTEKISNLPLNEIEKTFTSAISAELKIAGVLGAVIGFLIGLFQVFLLLMTQ
ncbi:DUF445 domain-containing protein [Segetibacter aerophilus]|nr:DUF445 family protein [Segetibacter aerophilus]